MAENDIFGRFAHDLLMMKTERVCQNNFLRRQRRSVKYVPLYSLQPFNANVWWTTSAGSTASHVVTKGCSAMSSNYVNNRDAKNTSNALLILQDQ